MKNFIKRSFALALMCAVTMASTSLNMITADASISEYKSWKQGDSRWGSVYLGSSGQTLSRIGCAVTSVAILMVHSGSVNDDDFDPGKLCNYLSSNGGFDGYGNIRWAAATGMAGSFTYQGGGTISGSQSAKAAEIASYLDSGYYALVSVKYGGHWVAVDYVSADGTVYMIDPARGTNTDLFSVYSASGVGQIRLFKGANSKSPVVDIPAVTEPVTTTSPAETTTAETTVSENVTAQTTVSENVTVQTTVSENVTAQTTVSEKETEVPAETTVVTSDISSPAKIYSEGRYTSTDKINIRSNPGTENKIIGVFPANTSAFAYEIKDNWGKISYNGVEGWISLEYTTYGGVVPFFTEGLYSTVADLNLRSEADINSKSKLIVPVSTTLPVTEIKDNWGKVVYNGTEGWICMDYTSYDGEIPEKESNVRTGEYFTFDQVNLRKGAAASYDTICRIPGYAKLNVTEVTEDNWGKVTFHGNEGWICLDYAKSCSNASEKGDINGDGYITINDYLLLKQEVMNSRAFTENEIAVSDLNDDGIVDTVDVELLEIKIG